MMCKISFTALSNIVIFLLYLKYVYGTMSKTSYRHKCTVVNPYRAMGNMKAHTKTSVVACAVACDKDAFCLSFYFGKSTKSCLTSPLVLHENEVSYYDDMNGIYKYYEKKNIDRRPCTCAEVKSMDPLAGDGHYWMYPQSLTVYGNRVKVYCDRMSEVNPREYITLPNPNIGVYPALRNINCEGEVEYVSGNEGTTTFYKIGVNPATMRIDEEDYTFANWTRQRYSYGYAGDCYTEHISRTERAACGPVGYFNGNYLGTGLKMNSRTYWTTLLPDTYYQTTGSVENFKVFCGGLCGACKPNSGGILLLINKFRWVDPESAVLLPTER